MAIQAGRRKRSPSTGWRRPYPRWPRSWSTLLERGRLLLLLDGLNEMPGLAPGDSAWRNWPPSWTGYERAATG